MIKIAQSDEEILACFKAMKELRTHLIEDEFIARIKELMSDGYMLASLTRGNEVACVAGFKISKNLFIGNHLYVEDLSTIESDRSHGYGKQMIKWLRDLAREKGCSAIHLDSGVHRHRAHKFYLNQNMDIICYHFLEKL